MVTKAVRKLGLGVVAVACWTTVGFAQHVSAVPMAARKFNTCAALTKVYKNGVAVSRKARGATKATVNGSVYAANKKLDLDGDGIACDAGDRVTESFVSRTYSGSGDQLIKLSIPVGAVAIASINFVGLDGISIATLDAAGEVIDFPVSSAGNYTGTVLLSRGDEGGTPSNVVSLDVSSDGDWTIRVSPATSAPLFSGTKSGSSDAVFRHPGPELGLTIDYQGEEYFSVGIFDKVGTLVDGSIDMIGPIDETYYVSAGAFISVRTVGSWSLAVG